MGKVTRLKVLQVEKYYNEENRKVIKLREVETGREIIGSYVDNQLMNVYVMNALLDYIEKGYKIVVNDQWK